MKKPLIITAVILVLGGFAVKEVLNIFNASPLGQLKQLNDKKEAVEKLLEKGPLEITPEQSPLKIQ
tara:strand:- start:2402 stop:2599 length:198 start_codon:yes stop_codon:yes gene_type:complete